MVRRNNYLNLKSNLNFQFLTNMISKQKIVSPHFDTEDKDVVKYLDWHLEIKQLTGANIPKIGKTTLCF